MSDAPVSPIADQVPDPIAGDIAPKPEVPSNANDPLTGGIDPNVVAEQPNQPSTLSADSGASTSVGDAASGDGGGPPHDVHAVSAGMAHASASVPNVDVTTPSGESATGAASSSPNGNLPSPSLRERVTAIAHDAFQAGMTDEHNLMIWVNAHLEAITAQMHIAERVYLTDKGRAVIDELRKIL